MQAGGSGRRRVRSLPAQALRRRADPAAARDQRLGGAADFASLRLPVPAGFSAEPVAAGLTAPVGVAAASDGLLYVAEAGHPRRTPPRLLRLDPRTGVASVIATYAPLRAPAQLSVTASGAMVYLAAAGVIWRIGTVTREVEPHFAATAARAGSRPGLFGGLFAGTTVSQGSLWLCDPGRPAGAPGAGLIWRVAPTAPGATVSPAPRPLAPAIVRRRPTVSAIAAVAVAAIALAWYYRERRAARRQRPVT